jgi:uncharacterized membrane protein YfcA
VPVGLVVVLGVLVGVATGALSATVGVGGAVVSTPGIRALGATPLEGVGSTLPSIFPSAITGTLRYHREELVLWPVVARVVPFGAVAAVLGAIASVHFPGKGHVQMILTAALVGYTAWRMWSAGAQPIEETGLGASGAGRAPWPAAAVIGLAAGGLSGFLGVGGGAVLVPAFRGWLRLGLKETVATSLACVGLLAVPSTLTHLAEGTVNWTYALPLCIGVVPGAHLGARWAVAASEARLRIVISAVLGVLSVAYFVAETIVFAR